MSKRISGIFAPINTPFKDNEDLAEDKLRQNLQRYSQTPLSGFLVLGSNGENKSLTEEEKDKILEIVLEKKAPNQMVIAGASCESTRETITLSKKYAGFGVDFVSLLSPSYFKKMMTDEAIIAYFTEVADAVPVPVLAYNAPGFTGLTMSAKVIEKICQHPNIAGMKDSAPGTMAGFLDVAAEDFDILAGTASTLFFALFLGAKGGVVSLANAFPEPCCRLYEKFMKGDVDGARVLHKMLFRLNKSVSGKSGVAGVKYASELGGYNGGNPRRPLLPITEEAKKGIKDAVIQAGLL